jgi:Tfp pilus assembly protein PilF
LLRLAGCQRRLKQYKEAHASLEKALRPYPSYPKAHVELARLYADEGERAKAATEVQAALAVWAHADEGFAPAAEARALLATLR